MPEMFTADMLQRIGLLVILFTVVVVVSLYGIGRWQQRQAIVTRLDETASQRGVSAGGASVAVLRPFDTRNAWIDLGKAVEKAGIPVVDPKDKDLRNRLILAGYTAPSAPSAYGAIRLLMVIGLPVFTFGLLWLAGHRPTIGKLYFVGMISAAMGLYLPSLFIRAKADRRQTEIVNGFPDALDLLLVCVEAGLGLESGFNRVGNEMTRSHPLIAEQFSAVVLELRAGRSYEDALRRMADRAGSDDIRGFATLLVQSVKLGSSISSSLRTYASEMRERRRMRAEEKAHRLPVLLSIPLVMFMLPTMIGVLMLPAVIRVMRILVPALGGHH